MSKGAKVDFDQLNQMSQRLDRALSQGEGEALVEEVLLESANRCLRKVKGDTPVISGNLRDNWFISDVTRSGNNLMVEVYNNVDYAAYVEYGHRQEVGRYVPALGKSLVQPWVKGRFMMTKAAKAMETITPKLLAKRTEAFLKELAGGD